PSILVFSSSNALCAASAFVFSASACWRASSAARWSSGGTAAFGLPFGAGVAFLSAVFCFVGAAAFFFGAAPSRLAPYIRHRHPTDTTVVNRSELRPMSPSLDHGPSHREEPVDHIVHRGRVDG